MIVKIQIPIVHSCPDDKPPQALIYNEDRSVNIFVPVDDVVEYFTKEELELRPKIYAKVKMQGKKITIIKKVKEQTW